MRVRSCKLQIKLTVKTLGPCGQFLFLLDAPLTLLAKTLSSKLDLLTSIRCLPDDELQTWRAL